MNCKIIVIDDKDEPTDSEVWMHREKELIFIVHPLFIHTEGQLNQVGFTMDNDSGENCPMLNMSIYKDLDRACELLGTFNKEGSIDDFSC